MANIIVGSFVGFYEANTSSGKLVRFYGRKNRDIYSDLISEGLQRFLFRQ